ncbi:putative PDDEXK endonuclease, partial [Methanoculleus sp. UBA312]|uniref:putative PDDEXK endonuclease n=1 Tax=Methanoculleus sp. UBA312 TaxID=1915499 RepID=UPI0031BB18F7
LNINPDDILSTAMGQGGCDLYLSPAARSVFPFGVEAKRAEALSIPAGWKQCETNASKVGLIPLLVFKRNREEPLAVLRWSDLLALLQQDHRWQNLAE